MFSQESYSVSIYEISTIRNIFQNENEPNIISRKLRENARKSENFQGSWLLNFMFAVLCI